MGRCAESTPQRPVCARASVLLERARTPHSCRPNLGAVGPRPCGRAWCSAPIGATGRSRRQVPRMMNGTNATGVRCGLRSRTTQHHGVPRRSRSHARGSGCEGTPAVSAESGASRRLDVVTGVRHRRVPARCRSLVSRVEAVPLVKRYSVGLDFLRPFRDLAFQEFLQIFRRPLVWWDQLGAHLLRLRLHDRKLHRRDRGGMKFPHD